MRKRYDRAKTPYERVLASSSVSEAHKRALRVQYEGRNPAQLHRRIEHQQEEKEASPNRGGFGNWISRTRGPVRAVFPFPAGGGNSVRLARLQSSDDGRGNPLEKFKGHRFLPESESYRFPSRRGNSSEFRRVETGVREWGHGR